MPTIRVGISGWQYKPWRGEFYPKKLPQRRELEYAARVLSTIEINGTFYSLKSPASFRKWAADVPDDFVFAIKGSRYITHNRRMREARVALANFFANGVLTLGRRLGPILWQFPPRMQWEPEIFEEFCAMLPRDSKAAAKLAGEHDSRVEGRMWFSPRRRFTIRHAFELRDDRMMNEQMIRSLRRHRHALVFADSAGRYPYAEDLTAGFVYIRLHGSKKMYHSQYPDDALGWWARRIRRWAGGGQMSRAPRVTDLKPPARTSRDVFVYFDNDVKVHAPFDALRLAQRLRVAADPHHLRDDEGEPLPAPPRLERE